MAKNAPIVRWYSSPIVFPEVVCSCRRYRLSSGNACKSSLNSLRVYLGSAMRFAIFLALSQSVERPRIVAASAPLAELLGLSGFARRTCIPATTAAVEVGSGTLRMRRRSWAASSSAFFSTCSLARFAVEAAEAAAFMLSMGFVAGSARSHVQMFSWVPMGSWSVSMPLLKLNSPSVVANSWPCGNPMHCKWGCSGWSTL
mmetsp:Transcript_57597/g.166738  ORF Transcript_57597/g.166738 Transcript_57597/m.166738 type:complete len:200 (+) Transcript_57597:1547-2146(+)